MPRLLLLLILLVPAAYAQTPGDSERSSSLDRTLLLAIHEREDPFTTGLMRAADLAAAPVMFAAAPALAVGALAGDRDLGPAYRMALTQLGTAAFVYGLKHSVRRNRPFVVEEGVVLRSPKYAERGLSFSFPSSHAAMAAATATSLSLSHPEWWVIVPSTAWASAVILSRPWLGLHYPSDVAVGALAGAGVAVLVHVTRDVITPSGLSAEQAGSVAIIPLLHIAW
jgi:membrane-associated phospholipid phosphatase